MFIFTIFRFSWFLIIVLVFSSCNKAFYGPGSLGTESRYMAKPFNSDTSGLRHYVSGGAYFNQGKGYQIGEKSSFAEGSYHFSLSKKFYTWSTGAGLYAGRYNVLNATPFNGLKSFWGGSATTEFSLNIPIKIVNWKIIGFRQSAFFEDGQFYRFRKQAAEQNIIFNQSSNHVIYNTSITSEIELNLEPVRIGFYGASGMSYRGSSFKAITQSGGVFVYYKDFTLCYQRNSTFPQGINSSLAFTYSFR